MSVRIPAPDESLWVGVLRLSLVVDGARSLKDRRRAVSQVRDRLRAKHNVSVADVGHLEDATRAIVAVTMVGNDPRFLRSALDRVVHIVVQWRIASVVDHSIDLLRPDEPRGFEGLSGYDDVDG